MKIFAIFAMFVFTSCINNMDLFTENSIEIKDFKQEKKLTGTILIENEYGHFNIAHVDKYLILFSVLREHFFYVYNINGDSLGAFGIRGQGPNDLINIQWCGQYYGTNMWINDVSNVRLCAVNITQSLVQKKCMFDAIVKNLNFSVNSFVWNDSLLISEQMRDNFYLIRTNIYTKRTSEEKLYNYSSQHLFSTYKSIWRMKPDGSKMAAAMQSINMINILDIKNNDRLSLIVNPPMTNLENIVDRNTGLEKRTYYVDMDVTDNYIYTLFMNQAYDESYMIEKEMEIHVFDWQGNPQYKYIIPQYITAFAIDESRNCIYGLSLDEKIYMYNVIE
jgi:hypothetical protein